MELSINITKQIPSKTLHESAVLFHHAGFTAADVSLTELEKENSPLSSANYRTVAEEMRREIESAGLKINQTHAPFRFPYDRWEDPTYYEEVIFPKFIRMLEISAILGAPISVIHPLHHWDYRGREEEIFEKNMAYYRRLIPYCKEYNVKVGVENMWRRDPRRKYICADTCSTIKEFIRYIDTLDSEYMVACLDVGHVGLPMTEEDVEAHDFVRALGHDRLKSLHIHDNDYIGDQHLLPYLGKMNWTELTRALGEINYTGDFTYEVGPDFLNTVDEEFLSIAVDYMGAVGKHLVELIEASRIL